MSRTALVVAGVVVIIVGILVGSSAFIVRQTEQAIVLQFGDPKRVILDPGLHFKIPFIQNVQYFDARVLDYGPPAEEVIAEDQKRLVVDSFLRYRITDPLRFYQSVGTELGAEARLSGVLNSSLRRVIGDEPMATVLSEERAALMRRIRDQVNEAATAFGIDVIDVRIRRADLPQANAEAIYMRMQSEREREAREFRAQGEEVAQRIRARAERERTVLLADSRQRSQVLRGQGDSQAIQIHADAYGRDPDFYAFYRSMEAYRESLGTEETTLVLSPRSDFFTYFGSLDGRMLDVDAPLLRGDRARDLEASLPRMQAEGAGQAGEVEGGASSTSASGVGQGRATASDSLSIGVSTPSPDDVDDEEASAEDEREQAEGRSTNSDQ